MSARHVGLPPGLSEAPGWTYTVDNTGLFTLKTTFSCHADDIIDLSPAIGSQHYRFRFAVLDEITGAREEGDLGKIDCIYKGNQPGQSNQDAPPVFQLVASTREEPIELHDRYKDVSLDDLATIKDVMDGKKKPSAAGLTGRALELLTKKLRGQESYLRKAVVWRETSTSAAGFTSLNDVGTISNPPGGAPSNNPGNWLLLSMDQKKQGSAWERIREWMASGKEGWDLDIYTG